MSEEDQEIMARISRVAGHINRHKTQQAGFTPVHGARPQRNHSFGASGSWHRGGHPYRSHYSPRVQPVHRHRSLVLNNTSQSSNANPGDAESATASDASSPSWVTKTDRHLQLINTSIYEKETQARTRAIEQTRRQKQTARDERERTKLIKHLHRMANVVSTGSGQASEQAPAGKYELAVQGIRFLVAKNGSKLVKVPGDGNSAKATPKMAVVGGVKFYRSKNGNLYRHGIVKAQRYVRPGFCVQQLTRASGRQAGAVKKVDVPCKAFSMTGNSIVPNKLRGPRPYRVDWDSVSPRIPTNAATGSCTIGPRCRYIHDPEKVAACKDYLQQGECANGESCDLSHDIKAERAPTCLHFVRDSCTKPHCRYAHVKVSPAAPVCQAFGLYGYCDKGASCPDRHAFECPDFSNTGVCKSKGCKLPHRERASVLRRATNAREVSGNDEMEDVSSDDDGESVNSDDVDSDEVDEFIGQDETGGLEFSEQKDFIEL
ncbi:hypothetical protein B0T26DRAFT_740578 [Lasiosphaeria miniovina]|uniref:C3H1-type domain-containing protein n=1 Tax=Lasiosphaeria miniovina TaxID=1954250 RepID=A0AA40DX93_9PEZI|nr:uncharacterized protein B0T26DRAFT_740578 [Lasiosphaeria miniovina]KAK0716992.1 hypothetical protein B0T26DRAFT_740578 [Lasiosphaeria miniovina]